ncbi:Holliday junction resolvase RecU [Collibacillus ludicampi]|uniref:Holliday junction resolvase RecU n=1 Tax=Collibacillus ludicampi TaxID=2771369 RepID=A0AAV4LDY3_9BACL|nr:Holliday junction resolvase RecU [Collibacillus ludicampi]GIM45941.1 Holliday junction resolvase RecU [Collibacillus ludicampi]
MTHANRGMGFEALINMTNDIYNRRGLALITKRPTPMKVISHTKVRGHHIAVFEKQSTVDYTGVYRGRAIEFEAKSTHSLTAWPIKDIHEHQVEHLRKVDQHGGIAFVLVEFVKQHAVYLLTVKHLLYAWTAAQTGGRKSIPLDEFDRLCLQVGSGRGVPVDYLAAVDQLIAEVESA